MSQETVDVAWPAGVTVLAGALLAAAGQERRVERLFVGGNLLGERGAAALSAHVPAPTVPSDVAAVHGVHRAPTRPAPAGPPSAARAGS